MVCLLCSSRVHDSFGFNNTIVPIQRDNAYSSSYTLLISCNSNYYCFIFPKLKVYLLPTHSPTIRYTIAFFNALDMAHLFQLNLEQHHEAVPNRQYCPKFKTVLEPHISKIDGSWLPNDGRYGYGPNWRKKCPRSPKLPNWCRRNGTNRLSLSGRPKDGQLHKTQDLGRRTFSIKKKDSSRKRVFILPSPPLQQTKLASESSSSLSTRCFSWETDEIEERKFLPATNSQVSRAERGEMAFETDDGSLARHLWIVIGFLAFFALAGFAGVIVLLYKGRFW